MARTPAVGVRRDVQVKIRLTETEAAVLDRARGSTSRVEYIRRLIAGHNPAVKATAGRGRVLGMVQPPTPAEPVVEQATNASSPDIEPPQRRHRHTAQITDTIDHQTRGQTYYVTTCTDCGATLPPREKHPR